MEIIEVGQKFVGHLLNLFFVYDQVENQSGEAMNLPYHERKALVTAMALHEKGRAALKKEDYPLALVIFLEADKEFRYITVYYLHILLWFGQLIIKALQPF